MLAPEEVKVSRIFHAGYIVETNQARVVFDPILTNPFSFNCLVDPPVELEPQAILARSWDGIFISHFHEDHCCLESLSHFPRSIPIYLYCHHPELADWIRQMGFQQVTSLSIDQPVFLKGLEVTPRRALDDEVDCMFQVQIGSFQLLNVVDSWIDWETVTQLESTRWDLILWPFQILREREVLSPSRYPKAVRAIPEAWREQWARMNPRAMVPSSCQFRMEDWSWYNQEFFSWSESYFESQVREQFPEIELWTMAPGESLIWSHGQFRRGPSLEGLRILGPARVVAPGISWGVERPSVSEVARNFAALDVAEKQIINYFCSNEIFERWAEVGPSAEVYFNRPRRWLLRIWDESGFSTDHGYLVDEGQLSIWDPRTGLDPEWLTEISAWKLHGALREGESLTSIYVRVNEMAFDLKTEKALKGVDPLSDPLIRCLYNGRFGSYQQAQLKRLLAAD